jgi:hypothetical protein
MNKIFLVILSCILILLFKLVINRSYFYIKPSNIKKPYKNIIKNKNILQFYINSTLTWYIPEKNISEKKLDKIIIFCHGNSYNITWKANILDKLSNNFNCPIICQDYLRIKNPSVKKMLQNTSNLVEYLFKKGYNEKSIIMFGESLGCSISLNIAKKYNIKNVICYIGFRKMSDIIKNVLPYLGYFVSLFTNELDNEKIIKTTDLNLTLLNSQDDKLVNFNHIQKMCIENNIELLEIYGSHSKPIIPDNIFLRLKEKYRI